LSEEKKAPGRPQKIEGTIRDVTVKKKFLRMLRSQKYCGEVVAVRRSLGISHSALYREKAAKPKFSAAWDRAAAEGRGQKLGVLESSAFQRAVYGFPKPTYKTEFRPSKKIMAEKDVFKALEKSRQMPHLTGYEHVPPSDALLMKLLAAENPEKYGPPQKKEDNPTDLPSLIEGIMDGMTRRGIAPAPELVAEAIAQVALRYCAKRGLLPEVTDVPAAQQTREPEESE
jgi:hypothetical protein